MSDVCKDLPLDLTTRRLLLRAPVAADVPALVRALSEWDVAKWMGRIPHPYAPCHARQWLVDRAMIVASGEHLAFVIAHRARPDLVIGGIGCHGLLGTEPVLGYWLSRPHWRRGYASEALAAVLAALWRINPAARPHATALPDNHGSTAVLRKAGFRRRPGNRWLTNRARRRKVRVVLFSHPGRPTPAAAGSTS